MVMSDDPFDDPATFDDILNEASAGGAPAQSPGNLQAFLTMVLGLPLAVWGGYTIVRDYLKEEMKPNPRPVRRPLRRPRPPADPSRLDVGTFCEYTKTGEIVEVMAVHREDGAPYYYTIRASDDSERQTVRRNLVVHKEEIAAEEEPNTRDNSIDSGVAPEPAEETKPEEPPPPPIHPEIKYAQSIELTEYREAAEPGPQTAFVIEATPAGLIAMGYDFEEKRWIYWANSTPHFRVLDAVARVYANTHNRHPLYIPPAVADAANEAEEKATTGGRVQEGGGEKIAADSKASLFITPTPVGAAEPPRPEKRHVANLFKRLGMLSELRFIPEGPREAPKKTSYSDFLERVGSR